MASAPQDASKFSEVQKSPKGLGSKKSSVAFELGNLSFSKNNESMEMLA